MKTILSYFIKNAASAPANPANPASGTVTLPRWYLPTIVAGGALSRMYPAFAEVATHAPAAAYSHLTAPLMISPSQSEIDAIMRGKLYLAHRNRLRQVQADLIAKYIKENVDKIEQELESPEEKKGE